jgi:hypothetical protein
MATTYTEIAYGPEHGAALRALLGENARNINNAIYEQPARAAYSLADGRCAIVVTTTYGFSSKVFVYDSYAEYMAAWYSTAGLRDPETGRLLR